MRAILVAGLVLTGAAGATAQTPSSSHGSGHQRLFISPMGEPFRSDGGTEPQDVWFQAADANHDGALSKAEFAADAQRFFNLLDRGHDGEIDPDDLEYYETVFVPEIRVSDGGDAVQAASTDDQGNATKPPPYPDRQGAGRFSYFPYPEPIIVADRNFNRGVDAREFQNAADDRFAVLDTSHDGLIRHDELPKISPPRSESGGGRGGHGGGGGHGHRRGGDGGMGGAGGMGGMGGAGGMGGMGDMGG